MKIGGNCLNFVYWIEISLIGRNNDDANGFGMRILEEQVNAL